jgi:hypothetical protein
LRGRGGVCGGAEATGRGWRGGEGPGARVGADRAAAASAGAAGRSVRVDETAGEQEGNAIKRKGNVGVRGRGASAGAEAGGAPTALSGS